MEMHSNGSHFEKHDLVQWRCFQMATILKSMTCVLDMLDGIQPKNGGLMLLLIGLSGCLLLENG
jgi:hypothetical protein